MTFDWKFQATHPRLVVSCFIDFCLHQRELSTEQTGETPTRYICVLLPGRSQYTTNNQTPTRYIRVFVFFHQGAQYTTNSTYKHEQDLWPGIPVRRGFPNWHKCHCWPDKQTNRQTDRQTDRDQHSIFVTKRRAITVRSKRSQTDTQKHKQTKNRNVTTGQPWPGGLLSKSHPQYSLISLYIYDSPPRVCCSFLSPTMHPVPYSPVHECTFLPMPPCWWMELDEEFEASLHVLGSGRGVEVHVQRLLPSSFEWTLNIPPRHHHCHCHFSDVLHIVRIWLQFCIPTPRKYLYTYVTFMWFLLSLLRH